MNIDSTAYLHKQRKPKRKRQGNNNEHDSIVVTRFMNGDLIKLNLPWLARLCLPMVMAPGEPNVPLSNDQDGFRCRSRQGTAAYAKRNLCRTVHVVAREIMEALMRSNTGRCVTPCGATLSITICYFNAVLLPRDHIMLDKYVEIVLCSGAS